MKLYYWVSLLFLATISPCMQEQPGSFCRLETRYDQQTDTTTVRCDLVELRGAPARVTIQAVSSYRGKEPNETAKFWLQLLGFTGDATRRTQPVFREATEISLISEANLLEIPVNDYGTELFELNRLLAESARAEISREDLRKLLDAQSLKGKWGNVEVKFSDASLRSLKSFITRQVFLIGTQ
jgi:hypothetical protein